MGDDYDIAVTVVCIAVVVFLGTYMILATFFCDSPKEFESSPKFTDEILNSLDDGDLVFLCGDTVGERWCRWWCGSKFSHVGMIVKENDEIYVLDSDLGHKMKDGVRIQKLRIKLDRWKGFKVIAIKKLINKPENIHELLLICTGKYKPLDFDNKMFSWFFEKVGKGDYFKSTDSVFCSEFVAMVLQDLGIITDSRKPYSYSPLDFYESASYENPQHYTF